MYMCSMALHSLLRTECVHDLSREAKLNQNACVVAELKMNPESLFALSIQLIALADKTPAMIQTERACSFIFLFESLNSC